MQRVTSIRIWKWSGILFVSNFTVLIIVFNYWSSFRSNFGENFFTSVDNNTKLLSASFSCDFPELDPWHPSILDLIEKSNTIDCGWTKFESNQEFIFCEYLINNQ